MKLLSFRAVAALALGWVATASAGEGWPGLAPFFDPPKEYQGQLGAFKSPLVFDGGAPVKTRAEWALRRAEILRRWTEVMGPWPPLLEKPALEVLREETRGELRYRRVRVPIAPSQTVEGWLLLPPGKGPHPAVVVPYYEPETSVGLSTNLLRDFGLQLARRGFVTLSIGSPGGDARKPEAGRAICQPLSFLGYVAANCHSALCQLKDVDPARIGIVGHSYGGKWAMFASCLYEKFACAAWSDGGVVFDEPRGNVNYWEPWYLGRDPAFTRKPGLISEASPRTGAYKIMMERGMDLHELHALMAPRPFLVSGGSEDSPTRWPALNHAVAVNQLLGYTHRVGMTNRKNHSPTPESNEQIYAFFEHFLHPAAR
jgi:dienelactone hydrolase